MHVCNDRTRFTDFREAGPDDVLFAGTDVIQIEGFGTVTIQVRVSKAQTVLFKPALPGSVWASTPPPFSLA